MYIDLNYRLIGQRLRAARKKQNITQERLAELAGISPQHCSGIETGAAKVSLPALVQLCNALKVSTDEILLDSVTVATKPGLLQEVASIFSDANADETYLMISQAKAVKEAVRAKGLLRKSE